MRFDDTLETVLAADLATPLGMQSAWRQLVDLIGRRRVPPDTRALAVLRRIRAEVPVPVRRASARGLELADPPSQLVRLLALDEIGVALPVLRSARMTSTEWIQILPELSPPGRAVLRNRRDLSPVVRRALESFGPIDFVLPDESPRAEAEAALPADVAAEEMPVTEPVAETPAPDAAPVIPIPVALAPEPAAPEPVALSEPEPPADIVEPAPEPRLEPVAVVPELAAVVPEPMSPEPVELVAEPEPQPVAAEPEPELAVELEPEPEPVAAEPSPEPATTIPEPEAEPVGAVAEAEPVTAEPEPVVATPEAVVAVAEAAAAPVAVAPPVPVFVPRPAVPPRPLPPERLVDWTGILDAPVPSWEKAVVAAVVAAPALADAVAAPAVAEPETVQAVQETIGSEPVEMAPAIAGPEVAEPEQQAAESEAQPEPVAAAAAQDEDYSFVALAGTAAALTNATTLAALPPVQTGTVAPEPEPEPIAPPAEPAQESAMESVLEAPVVSLDPVEDAEEGPFEIAEVVARIDAFWRNREDGEPAAPRVVQPAAHFRFETDSQGVIRWVDGASRAAIVGLSLDLAGPSVGGSRVDGIAAGAFRRRAGFSNARLEVDGDSDAAGGWLISAIPVFDPANGRFTGYRGTARRPRADERAEPTRHPAPAPDSLRQLVHELRTPTNAIAGFAEMIETQMLGPVADTYRDRAGVIRGQARELLGAIDDLDLAARIDSAALSLAPGRIVLRPLLAGIADDLAQLATLRGSWIALPVDDLAVSGDRRAIERLLARLMATLVSASGSGERIGVRTAIEGDATVAITLDRPMALSDYPGDSVLGIDDESDDATLLGTGFALRLARNLARELGGSLVIEAETLTLRLPAAENIAVGQAHLS